MKVGVKSPGTEGTFLSHFHEWLYKQTRTIFSLPVFSKKHLILDQHVFFVYGTNTFEFVPYSYIKHETLTPESPKRAQIDSNSLVVLPAAIVISVTFTRLLRGLELRIMLRNIAVVFQDKVLPITRRRKQFTITENC